MEEKLSSVSKKFAPSPIQELSHLAQRCNAINLAEGFPDFPAPPYIKEAAVSAINSDFNQYRHVQGICDHLALIMKRMHGLNINPLTDIAICCGQTEAFAAAIFSIINRGDEVVLFDPCYETYEGCITMAGGIPVYVGLDPPKWTLDPDKLMRSFTTRTKAIVLNSPHNPTGKVFSKGELEVIAEGCRRWDCLVITDEVYEYITFDDQKHVSIASLPGMQERTIITSSLSKTFSITGTCFAFKEPYFQSLPPESCCILLLFGMELHCYVYQGGELDGLLHQLLQHLQSETFMSKLQILLQHHSRKLP
ncbi:hypothetical protein DITRI_Ditri13aG0073000 [Diplodiscus trichospermus]